MENALLISVFVVSVCSLIYELVCSTLASYLLGDSVTQFSTIIGTYLFAMGIGSWASKHIEKNLLTNFIKIEILLGLVGGFSAPILFASFNLIESFRLLLYSLVFIIGFLVGLEIPLLTRILKDQFELKDLISKVLTFDYIGALFASLLFPLVMIPYFGAMQTSLIFGILNLLIALWLIVKYRAKVVGSTMLMLAVYCSLLTLSLTVLFANSIISLAEVYQYPGRVIYSKQSQYQKLVLTRDGQDFKFYLNGNLQFSSMDEYRYHEALVHPAFSYAKNKQKILILGGGDGLALREILKYDSVQEITLVDLDTAVTDLFKTNQILRKLNNNSLNSEKLRVINSDAFIWIKNNPSLKFDIVIVDFPDPTNFSIGKLYSETFYKLLSKQLKPESIVAVQSTSAYFAPNAYWSIARTLESSGYVIKPYHVYVPSFGDWGYVLATPGKFYNPAGVPQGLKFISNNSLTDLFIFPPDMAARDVQSSDLNNQKIVSYFEADWSKY